MVGNDRVVILWEYFCSYVVTHEDLNCLYSKLPDEKYWEPGFRTASILPNYLMQNVGRLRCTWKYNCKIFIPHLDDDKGSLCFWMWSCLKCFLLNECGLILLVVSHLLCNNFSAFLHIWTKISSLHIGESISSEIFYVQELWFLSCLPEMTFVNICTLWKPQSFIFSLKYEDEWFYCIEQECWVGVNLWNVWNLYFFFFLMSCIFDFILVVY